MLLLPINTSEFKIMIRICSGLVLGMIFIHYNIDNVDTNYDVIKTSRREIKCDLYIVSSCFLLLINDRSVRPVVSAKNFKFGHS